MIRVFVGLDGVEQCNGSASTAVYVCTTAMVTARPVHGTLQAYGLLDRGAHPASIWAFWPGGEISVQVESSRHAASGTPALDARRKTRSC